MNIEPKIDQTVCLFDLLTNFDEIAQTTESATVLDTIQTIALHALEALHVFRDEKYSLFDPSIGDESCQIRALMIVELSGQKPDQELNLAKESLLSLVSRVEALRSELVQIDTGAFLKEAELAASKEKIALKKKTLNEERQSQLAPLPRGGDQAKECLKVFSKKMEKLCEEERPILDEIKKNKEAIFQKKLHLLNSSELEVAMPKAVRQIIICYLLAKVKHTVSERLNDGSLVYHNKMQIQLLHMPGLTFDKKLIQSIVDSAKKILNHESVEFLAIESKRLTGKRAKLIEAAVQAPLISAKKGFREVSFYHGGELVMKRLHALGISILVRSREPKSDRYTCRQLYAPIGEKNKFVPVEEAFENQPVIVIEGLSQNAERDGLCRVIEGAGGLMKMVRLNLAQHRLCTGQKQMEPMLLFESHAAPINEVEKIFSEQRRAVAEGYAILNPSQLVIDHLYADTLNNQMK